VVASAFAKLSGSKPGRHNIMQNNMGCVASAFANQAGVISCKITTSWNRGSTPAPLIRLLGHGQKLTGLGRRRRAFSLRWSDGVQNHQGFNKS